MNAFDQLHPAVQHHIVNSLGWPKLRPLQEATIEPVIRGEHAILLAPTAGGKTEAAVFPVFSRMLSENWQGLSVIYICPIKALLNNLEVRLSNYGHLLGRSVAVWHGDTGAGTKARALGIPPDILLTTPESLEVILDSRRTDHSAFFANVKTIIIDEVHAFAGDDRGWHLLAVLERISVLAGRELQRLGLSATVGNPQQLCDWLAGSCQAPRSVINPPTDNVVLPDIQVDWVGSISNAAIVISRLHRGEKRLVFVDSRARVEELAVELRRQGVQTFVSHSCLSLTERQSAEDAFAQGNDCVIVATSTLELGIDVGDLDRVIQIDAPFTVSSFLQRIGRTGRRAGASRNCLFLATKEDGFLRALALLRLWREGFVEPVEPPPLPLHLYAQQIMALTLQESGMIAQDFDKWVGKMPGFLEISPDHRHRLEQHMLDTGILHSDNGILGIGRAGEANFGHKNFMELFSVFTSPPLVRVFHGNRELGEVHQTTFAVKNEGPAVLTLGGRSWITKYIDWPRKRAFVEPTDIKGRSQWLSSGQPMHFEMCQAMANVLLSTTSSEKLSDRGKDLFSALQEEFEWLTPNATILQFDDEGNAVWWTFAGKLFNAAAMAFFRTEANKLSSDNLGIFLTKVFDREAIAGVIKRFLSSNPDDIEVPLEEDFINELKFSECLSQEDIDLELSSRYTIHREFEQVKKKTLVVHRL